MRIPYDNKQTKKKTDKKYELYGLNKDLEAIQHTIFMDRYEFEIDKIS